MWRGVAVGESGVWHVEEFIYKRVKKIKCVSFISSIGLCIVDQVQRYARHAFAVITIHGTQYIVEKYIVEIEVK